MTSLPHPILDERLRQNLEHIEKLIVDKYVYIEFNSLSKGHIFTFPVNAIILFGTVLFITDSFDVGTKVQVGEVNDNKSLFTSFVDKQGVPEIVVGNLDSNITTEETLIYIGFTGILPTKGSGWFIVHYLLKDRL